MLPGVACNFSQKTFMLEVLKKTSRSLCPRYKIPIYRHPKYIKIKNKNYLPRRIFTFLSQNCDCWLKRQEKRTLTAEKTCKCLKKRKNHILNKFASQPYNNLTLSFVLLFIFRVKVWIMFYLESLLE